MNLHGKKFLVIEDDRHVFSLIKAMLKQYEIELVLKKEGEAALKYALEEDYDLVLLDIMLPGRDGWEICRELRAAEVNKPIIILTAKVEEADKVLGLEIGADDYVTKPFSPRELIARIKAVLRRYEASEAEEEERQLYFSDIDLKIDEKSYSVYIKDEQVLLAPKEFELLSLMARNEKQVFTREQLLDRIWGYESFVENRTIDEHIKRIRKKLQNSGLEEVPIRTVWGVGYKFEREN